MGESCNLFHDVPLSQQNHSICKYTKGWKQSISRLVIIPHRSQTGGLRPFYQVVVWLTGFEPHWVDSSHWTHPKIVIFMFHAVDVWWSLPCQLGAHCHLTALASCVVFGFAQTTTYLFSVSPTWSRHFSRTRDLHIDEAQRPRQLASRRWNLSSDLGTQ